MLTLVLLPGMDGTGHQFKPLIDAVGTLFAIRIVRYPATGAQGYAELEAVARAELPTQGPFVILGESFSGPIAISLAASKPNGLVGLVLCCTFARNPRPVTSLLRSLVRLLPIRSAPTSIRNAILLGRFATPALRALLADSLAQVSSVVLRHRLREVIGVNVSAKLAAIDVPVLYLQATLDRLVPSAAATIIAKALPATEIMPIEAPHCLLQTAPVEAAHAIAAFIHTRCTRADG